MCVSDPLSERGVCLDVVGECVGRSGCDFVLGQESVW